MLAHKMILSRHQMISAEQAAFATGASAEGLMESAGCQMAGFVIQNHPEPGTCRAFAGKGHNGGDVLVAARYLSEAGWKVEIRLTDPDGLAPLTASQLARLNFEQTCRGGGPLVVMDGLLGIGASGAPRGPVAAEIEEINRLRRERGAWVFCADLPSGLDPDTGIPFTPCVVADATMTMGFVKSCLLADAATNHVGRLAVAALGEVQAPADADATSVLTPRVLRAMAAPRGFDTHKGIAGRVAVLAGSPGFLGAARLCSGAAVLGGAGLVSLFVKPEVYPLVASAGLPEVMVHSVQSYAEVLESKWDAIAIGPGLSTRFADEILHVIRHAPGPCVVDADALNAIAGNPGVLSFSHGPRLLTPHPGEMERLMPCAGRERRCWMQDFVERYPVTLLLKGARTVIGEQGQPAAFNTTGHPGMASGGMGDVLTGVTGALIAQGQGLREAAMLGVWLCGRSAEIAITHGASQESLCASDVMANLGRAFASLRRGEY